MTMPLSADPVFKHGIAFIDGAYVPIAEAKLPLLDLGFIRSDACQDTISVWQGRFFRLEDHLARFERSFTRLRMTCPHDRDGLRAIAMGCVQRTGRRVWLWPRLRAEGTLFTCQPTRPDPPAALPCPSVITSRSRSAPCSSRRSGPNARCRPARRASRSTARSAPATSRARLRLC